MFFDVLVAIVNHSISLIYRHFMQMHFNIDSTEKNKILLMKLEDCTTYALE